MIPWIGLSALAFLAPALASAAAPRTGPAAYGDWRADAPGVVRLIRPSDLPPPRATPSASSGPSVASRPGHALPRVPPGFHVELVASGLETPRTLRRAPNGDVFLAESGAGRVLILRPGTKPTVFAEDLSLPFGIGFWPPGPDPRFVYVAESGRVVRFPYRSGDLKAGGRAETVVPHLPEGGHWTRDLAFSPDGRRMFVSVGSASNIGTEMSRHPPAGFAESRPPGAAWGDEQDRADVLVADPDGGNLRVFATGLRNCSAEAIQPGTGALWCAVNERDGLGDNLPPDYATEVREGAFYGWPWFYIGDHEDPRLKGRRPDLAGRVAMPDVLIQPHSAPLGITFYDGAQFPPDYRGDAFVALHGSWNRGQRTGYKVIRLRFRDGRATGEYEDFLTGFVISEKTVWGRPVGVAVDKDGALLVSEDGNGTVWRVTYGP
jgi:glucose/arabinose dehydrogenase